MRSVSPLALGTTVLVRNILLEDTQTRSCQDYKAAGVDKSGLYKIIDNTNQTLQVFCDFNSEPGFAWNLVESFSLSNKHFFQVNILNELEENLLSDLERKTRGPLYKNVTTQG